MSSFGFVISARPTASICCSPPDRVRADWPARSPQAGEEGVDLLQRPGRGAPSAGWRR